MAILTRSILAGACMLSAVQAQVGSLLANGRPSGYTVYNFTQKVDHFPGSSRYTPSTNDTFEQKYVFDNTYYKPGGPVFLYIGGETDLASRYSNLQTGIIQILMQATNGLGVILENRYYGDSYPYDTSTTDQLRFLTTEQTIADNAYFAQHASFENVTGGDDLTADKVPWILYGGSLAGAQTAFSLVEYSGLLWGGIASSATIVAVKAYQEWYYPIQKFGPSDCVTRINNIVDKMDYLIAQNNTEALQQLKSIFGLGSLSDLRDFAMTIAFPVGGPDNYPTYTWQELNWYPRYDHEDFFQFCSNVTNPNPPANISAVDSQLAKYTNGQNWTGLGGYADYVKQVVVSTCADPSLIDTTACFSTQNQSYWADTTNSALRSYTYTLCTEQGSYQVPPFNKNTPSLLSRVIDESYTQQWCTWSFPSGQYLSAAVSPSGPNLTYYGRYGGFNISAPRLALIDGSSDVWLDLCYHGRNSTTITDQIYGAYGGGSDGMRYGENQYLINGGGHHWDSSGILNVSAEPDFIREAHLWEIRTVNAWLREWDDTHSKHKRDEL